MSSDITKGGVIRRIQPALQLPLNQIVAAVPRGHVAEDTVKYSAPSQKYPLLTYFFFISRIWASTKSSDPFPCHWEVNFRGRKRYGSSAARYRSDRAFSVLKTLPLFTVCS